MAQRRPERGDNSPPKNRQKLSTAASASSSEEERFAVKDSVGFKHVSTYRKRFTSYPIAILKLGASDLGRILIYFQREAGHNELSHHTARRIVTDDVVKAMRDEWAQDFKATEKRLQAEEYARLAAQGDRTHQDLENQSRRRVIQSTANALRELTQLATKYESQKKAGKSQAHVSREVQDDAAPAQRRVQHPVEDTRRTDNTSPRPVERFVRFVDKQGFPHVPLPTPGEISASTPRDRSIKTKHAIVSKELSDLVDSLI